ncbi:hypothetical protein BASA81_011625 [Batrachochytrium salamandrivorans]|nr:hypothetical protein BASA81_011625 [Batrachochytrium salamandrivorans]
MDPMSRYTLSTTHPTPAAQLTPDCPVSDFSGLSVLPDTSPEPPIHSPTIPENFENFHFFHDFDPPGMVSDDSESMVPLGDHLTSPVKILTRSLIIHGHVSKLEIFHTLLKTLFPPPSCMHPDSRSTCSTCSESLLYSIISVRRKISAHWSAFFLDIIPRHFQAVMNHLCAQRHMRWNIRAARDNSLYPRPRSNTPIKPPPNSRRIISWNINGLVSKRNDLREHIAEVKPLLLMLQETNLDTNAFRFTAPKYSFIQHPASGPGKRGIALGFLAVLPAREIEGVPGTLILAKVPGLTEQQRKVSSWGFGLHVVSFSGSKATFRGRTATARWSSIDHFVCNQAARALLTSPRVNRQPYISDHWPIYASLLAVPPTPPDVFIPTFNPVRCKELAPTISLCNQFSILANLPDDCDSDTVTNRLLDIINPNTAFSSLSNLPLIDTPVPVQHRRLYRATTKKAICKAKNAYRAWLASRDSILSPQETIQGKYNQYILAEATASRLTKQDDRLRWRSHCTRIDNLLAGGCAKQAWNAAKRMACASGHSCRSSNPIRNEEGVLQFQPISICNTLRSHYMRLAEAGEGHSLDPTHWETMPQPPQHIPPSSTLSMDLPFSLRELDHALGSMHPRKAPGDDGITTALMQAIAHDPKDHGTGDVNLDRPGALALLRVANTIFLSGVIPKVWRCATIISIPKKGDATLASNLRGISLINVGLKILCKMVQARLSSLLESNNVLVPEQGLSQEHHPRGLMFADDIAIIAPSHESLCTSMGTIADWATRWEMSFGVAKCGIMHVAPIPAPLSRLRFCQLNHSLEQQQQKQQIKLLLTPSSHPSSPISPSSPLSIYSDISSTSSYHPSSPLSTSSSIYIPASPLPQPALFSTPATPTQTQLTHPIQLHGIDLPSVSQYEYLGVIIDDLLNLSPWLVKKKRAITAAVHSISPLLRNNFLSTRYRLTIFNGLVLGVAYYGLELIGGNSTLARRLQAPVNTGIRMILKAPYSLLLPLMLTDCGIISLDAHAILARLKHQPIHPKHPIHYTPAITYYIHYYPHYPNHCRDPTPALQVCTRTYIPSLGQVQIGLQLCAGKPRVKCKFLRSPALSTGQAIGASLLSLARCGGLWDYPRALKAGLLHPTATNPDQLGSPSRCILCHAHLDCKPMAHLVVDCTHPTVVFARVDTQLLQAINDTRVQIFDCTLHTTTTTTTTTTTPASPSLSTTSSNSNPYTIGTSAIWDSMDIHTPIDNYQHSS